MSHVYRRRVTDRSGVYTQIVYGPLGNKLALMNGQTLTKAFVPLPAGATAVYAGATLSYYRHSDWLGSSRFASTPTRTMRYDGAYAPYGENYAETGTTDRSFTGQHQDTTADLYDFMFREYNYTHGRWMSPDPLAGSVLNPQSLNRYAYVLNNPTNLIDPLGLQHRDPEERQERIEEIIQRVGMMEARAASFMATGCRLDGVPINCGVLSQAIRAGITNVEPIFSSGATLTGWVQSGINVNIVGYIPGTDIPVYTLSPVYSLFSINLVGAGQGPFGGTVPRVNRRKARNELETLVVGLNALTTPLQNLAVSGGFLVTGTTLIGTGVGLIGAGCFGSGGLACGAAIFGGAHAVAGGGVLLYAGYEYTRQVTIPSFVGLYEGLVPGH